MQDLMRSLRRMRWRFANEGGWFTIPNRADAFHRHQSRVDTGDLSVLLAAQLRTGVVAGCEVTAQGTPDNTVAVAAGTIAVAGVLATVTAGNLTIGAGHASNPRIDLIVVASNGTKSVTAGTAAAEPEWPDIPANSVVLAAVYVEANESTIESNKITDKRVPLVPGLIGHTYYNPGTTATIATSSSTFVDADATNLAVTFVAPASGAVLVRLNTWPEIVNSANLEFWNLRDASGDITGTLTRALWGVTTNLQGPSSKPVKVTGLTPGTSYTWKWGIKSGSSGQTVRFYAGGDIGPAVMEVWAL